MHTPLLALLVALPPLPQEAPAPEVTASTVARLQAEAERLQGVVSTRGALRFLAAVRGLPEIAERSVRYDAKTRDALDEDAWLALPEEERARFELAPLGGDFYYMTRSGSPLAYVRALEVLGTRLGPASDDVLSGKRVLDFGYGGIGHLRLLASLGCDAVGVDIDPLLRAYYRPEDQGEVAGYPAGGPSGHVTLVHGHWPAEPATAAAVGGSYDLVLSKNVLKKGYVRPDQKVDPRMLVDLGVTPEAFLAAVAGALRPGGIFAIYNLCPAKRPDRYIPWAYGESPFTRAELEAAGFEVLAFDVDDRDQAMELGFALGWDDVENDLFAWYTVARRRPG